MSAAQPSSGTRRLPPLGALRAFEAAARHMSVKRAAAELAVTPTAVSHQLRLLEETIGLRLFERRPRRLLLTPAGQTLFPVLRDGFDAFAETLAAMVRRRQRAVVTLSATRAFTARWLVPRVGAFRAANPDLDLRLHAADEPVDLRSGVADAAVRYGTGPRAGLAAEEMFRDAVAPVCAPGLGVRRPGDLAGQTLIHFEWHRTGPDTPVWRLWLERAGLREFDPPGLVFTDESHAILAAVAGHGVALLSLPLVAEELASGALVQPFGPVLDSGGCYLVYAEETRGEPGIEAVRAWLRGEAAAAGAFRSEHPSFRLRT